MATWLITGCSTGLGRALAQAVLAHGHNAVVTACPTAFWSRKPEITVRPPIGVRHFGRPVPRRLPLPAARMIASM